MNRLDPQILQNGDERRLLAVGWNLSPPKEAVAQDLTRCEQFACSFAYVILSLPARASPLLTFEGGVAGTAETARPHQRSLC